MSCYICSTCSPYVVEHDIVLFTTLQFPLIISVARPCMPTAWIRPHKHGTMYMYVIACVYVLSVLALYCNNDVGYA